MSTPNLDELIHRKTVLDEEGSERKAAEKLGISRRTLRTSMERYARYVDEGLIGDKPLYKGQISATQRPVREVPKVGVKRYILTCAQNNTPIHSDVWRNLLAIAEHYDAEIMVSRFTYNHNAFSKLSVKPGTSQQQDDLWYDSSVMPYVCDQSIEIAPGLVWCGDLNIIPTADRPLSGFEAFTGRKSAVIPHTKFAMESVASGKAEPTKINYTTGTVTQRNYIQKKAGMKAEFHHGYGAVLVEVDSDGNWFVRQLNADTTGTIYDLDIMASEGTVTMGHDIEGISWGDIHGDQLEDDMRELCWGADGILDTLKPAYQFFHDVVDFRARNHHDRLDPHRQFAKFVDGCDDVEAEIQRVSDFLWDAERDWCQSVVVDSNHDNAMTRWLKESDYRFDPVNAIYFLEAQLTFYRELRQPDPDAAFHLIEWALWRADCPSEVRFLREDESFVICHEHGGGIECGMHGHLGPNGSRGTPNGLKRLGRKANTGHTHSAGIHDGLYVAGVLGKLDQGYNVGPSSWSHSSVVTYPNGKRCILTIWNGKWRA